MTLDKQEVCIIGGGPTGLMAGILLSRRGILTTIVEKNEWPIDKVCGEGIMPLGVGLLRKYDLLKFIDPMWSRKFVGIKYIDKSGESAEGYFKEEDGLVVRRIALSGGLYEAAKRESLLTLLPNHELLSFQETPDKILVTTRELQTQETVLIGEFDYLVGADGLRSKVRALTNRDGELPVKQKNRMGARVHYEIPPWDNKVQIWWEDGIECYVAPTSENCVEFNFGWDPDMVQPQKGSSRNGVEGNFFEFFPLLKDKIRGAKRLSPFKSWGPLPHKATTPLDRRVVLIGDSSIFYDQITGEGLSLAFLQAELLSETLPTWHTPQGRAKFLDTIKLVGTNYVRVTNFAMFFTRHPLCRKWMIRLLNRSPRLFTYLLHLNMGEYSVFRPPVNLLLQAIFFPKNECCEH